MIFAPRLFAWSIVGLSLILLLSPALAQRDQPASRNGGAKATTTAQGVFVRLSPHGPLKPVFLNRHPQALFATLEAIKAGPLKELAVGFDADLAKDPRQWTYGRAVVTPDGHTVIFATNLGQGMGAQGNTSYVLVRADVGSGRLTLLRGAGEFFGRDPEVFALSPDSRSLLISLSAHDSAARAPYSVGVVNLTTQHTTDLLGHDPEAAHLSNRVYDALWSSNSRQIAVQITWYNADNADKVSDDNALHGMAHWEIKDARTGLTVRRLSGTASPWGRRG